jgi:hypothetical protein
MVVVVPRNHSYRISKWTEISASSTGERNAFWHYLVGRTYALGSEAAGSGSQSMLRLRTLHPPSPKRLVEGY